MRLFSGIAVIVAAIAAAPALAQPGSPAADLPAWLAGAWVAEQPDGSWTEEWWTPPKAGLMLGAGRSGKGSKLEWWEQTRIEQMDGKIRFCALPRGQSGACFGATKVAGNEIVFENTGHDFPTRVAYRKEGEEIVAEISGPPGTTPQRWRFRGLGD